MIDTKTITKSLTTAEKIRNNVVIVLGVVGSVAAHTQTALGDADFTTWSTAVDTLPAVLAIIGSRFAYGLETVKRLVGSA